MKELGTPLKITYYMLEEAEDINRFDDIKDKFFETGSSVFIEKTLAKAMEHEGRHFFAAGYDGKKIETVSLMNLDRKNEINIGAGLTGIYLLRGIEVIDDERGKFTGAVLLAYACRELLQGEKGGKHIILLVTPKNKRARKFFKKIGFVKDEVQQITKKRNQLAMFIPKVVEFMEDTLEAAQSNKGFRDWVEKYKRA